MKLAEELKKAADEKHSKEISSKAQTLINMCLNKAKSSAKDGGYNCRLYDGRLEDSDIGKQVKSALVADGFKVTIAEDSAYSKHAGSIQMYIELSW